MSATIAAYGRLGADPRRVATKTGKAMATCNLAVDAGKDEDAAPLWLKLLAFGGRAEQLLEHHRGEAVSVFGRLELNAWTGADGEARETLQVIVEELASAKTVRPRAKGKRTEQGKSTVDAAKDGTPFNDDLPF
ncbi:MAG: single-stranded DNA-binding protein [Gammaproteobacteria bacterium]|nr:single-stranded DNA-binding protein [Gammaproteobacteria bacterium]